MSQDKTILQFPESPGRKIGKFKDFKTAFLSSEVQAAGMQLYLIGFCDCANAMDMYPGGVESVDFLRVVSAIPNTLRGIGVYQITETQYLVVDTGYDTFLRQDLSIEIREGELAAHLTPMLSSIPVVAMIHGELVRISDANILFAYIRGLRRLQEKLVDATIVENPDDDLYQSILPRQPKREDVLTNSWTSRFRSVVNVENDLGIESYLVRPEWRQPVFDHSDTEGKLEDEDRKKLKLTLISIQDALDALQLFKQVDCQDIRMNIRVPYRVLSQGHLVKALVKKYPDASIARLPMDIEISDIPKTLRLDKRVNFQFDTLNRYGCRLLLVDECGINHSLALLGKLPVSGITGDSFLIANLENPAVRFVLAGYIAECRDMHRVLLCSNVDTYQKFKTLCRLGANYVIGDYLGQPEKVEKIIRDLKFGAEIEVQQEQFESIASATCISK